MPSVKLTASGYTGLTGASVSSSYPMTRAYEDSSDTSDYARLSISTSTTGHVYLLYDTSEIPANATITSITANARLRISSGSRVTNRICQLYTGTTAKGNSVGFSSTSSGGSVVSPTAGSWTRAELNDLRMYIEGTGSSSNQSKYIYIYGTDITVEYSVPSVVHVTGVSLDKSTDTVAVGSTTTLTETVTPSNAADKTVSWSTSNSSVATVSGGVVTGVAAGTAIITVTTTDGGYTDTCTVTVTGGGGGTWTTIFDDDVYIVPDSPYNYIYVVDYSGGAFEANTTYRITWDGVVYTCQSQPNSNTYDGYSVGNLALGSGGTDTGEPFLLYRASWDSTVLTADTTSDAGEWGRTIHCKIEKLSGGNPPPVITVGTPSRSVISDESGVNQCTCTFTSDLALQAWEARATKGVTPARGVGLLVESGTTLAAGATGTVVVDWNELTNGDGEYVITVYGQSTDGVWSA